MDVKSLVLPYVSLDLISLDYYYVINNGNKKTLVSNIKDAAEILDANFLATVDIFDTYEEAIASIRIPKVYSTTFTRFSKNSNCYYHGYAVKLVNKNNISYSYFGALHPTSTLINDDCLQLFAIYYAIQTAIEHKLDKIIVYSNNRNAITNLITYKYNTVNDVDKHKNIYYIINNMAKDIKVVLAYIAIDKMNINDNIGHLAQLGCLNR